MDSKKLIKQLKEFLSQSLKPLISICAPTASGKTALGVKLCHQFNGEVINADSRQIYDEIQIGNERTKPEEMEGVPHHLLAFIKPNEFYSIGDFKRDAEFKIDDILSREKIPFLVGGTNLWVNAVTENYLFPGDYDQSLREEIRLLSMSTQLKELKERDPVEYKKLKESNNPMFISRALEICRMTDKPKSTQARKGKRKYDVFKISIEWPRDELYKRINSRTEHHVNNGLIEEAETLVKKYCPKALTDKNFHITTNSSSLPCKGRCHKVTEGFPPALSSIGAKEVIPYLRGQIDKPELIRLIRRNCRRYAKRQISWLRGDSQIHWLKIKEAGINHKSISEIKLYSNPESAN